MEKIKYIINKLPNIYSIIELYKDSGIIRPIDDIDRIKKMYENSNIVISAYNEDELVGIARSLTDYSYVCYLSDLAVKDKYQKSGIGKKLIELIQKEIGEDVSLILLSSKIAKDYYPKIGFDNIDNGYIIRRKNK